MASAAIKGKKTLAELPAVRCVPEPDHAAALSAPGRGFGVFGQAAEVDAAPGVDVKTLRAKIGELVLENVCSVRSARPVKCRAQGNDRPRP